MAREQGRSDQAAGSSQEASAGSTKARVVAWLDAGQVDLVRDVCVAGNLELVSAGCTASAQSGAVAAELGCPVCDDLRQALTEGRADVALLASTSGLLKGEGGIDVGVLEMAASKGMRIASLEPMPSSAIEMASERWQGEGAAGVRVVPLPRHSRPFRVAGEPLASIGPVATLLVECVCAAREASLAARIIAAVDLVLLLMGEPETVDAAYVGPGAPSATRALTPGESLDDLHGTLTANVRFADGRSACLFASNQAGRWNTSALALGPGGRIKVYDDGFEWLGLDGTKIDESRFRRGLQAKLISATPAASNGVTMIAEAITRLLDPHIPDVGPADMGALLGVAQAALLSARTRQPESPATIRRMIERHG